MLIENGKIKTHVMQDFSKTPLNTETHLNNWLKFYEVSPPLVGLGYLISHDPVSLLYLAIDFSKRKLSLLDFTYFLVN